MSYTAEERYRESQEYAARVEREHHLCTHHQPQPDLQVNMTRYAGIVMSRVQAVWACDADGGFSGTPSATILGPSPISVIWAYGGGIVPISLCGQHDATMVCTWCPCCVYCHRPMSNQTGHRACDEFPRTD